MPLMLRYGKPSVEQAVMLVFIGEVGLADFMRQSQIVYPVAATAGGDCSRFGDASGVAVG